MRTELQETEIYKSFKRALAIDHEMRPDDNPWVVKCCDVSKKQAIEFAAWVRTFEPLEKKDGFWVVEQQISDEELFELYLSNREEWIKEQKINNKI